MHQICPDFEIIIFHRIMPYANTSPCDVMMSFIEHDVHMNIMTSSQNPDHFPFQSKPELRSPSCPGDNNGHLKSSLS